MSEKRILSIIPADGWVALYKMDEKEEPCETPLVCFALVSDGEYTYVDAIDADDDGISTSFCSEVSNFITVKKLSNQ